MSTVRTVGIGGVLCHNDGMAEGEIVTRRARPTDRAAILDLCRSSLGWSPDDPDEAFFNWKHDENAFGPSPSWVAEAEDGSLVGLRVFLRWRFRDERGADVSAVRAVDTATHPDWRGRGIFSKLTLGALPDLRDEGVSMVFNTPNDKSMPGYLKMGWSVVGKVPVVARVRSVGSIRRVLGARTAAELWSEPVTTGEAAADCFGDEAEVQRLLDVAGRSTRFATERSVEFLRWRYGFGPLHYRAFPLGDSLADGVIVFRVRRRGEAIEVAVCDVIAPRGARTWSAFGHIARSSGADYLLAGRSTVGPQGGFLPVPKLGPTLTWRPLADDRLPSISDLALGLGDIELF